MQSVVVLNLYPRLVFHLLGFDLGHTHYKNYIDCHHLYTVDRVNGADIADSISMVAVDV